MLITFQNFELALRFDYERDDLSQSESFEIDNFKKIACMCHLACVQAPKQQRHNPAILFAAP